MPLLDYIRLLINILALATGIALIFVALIPQKRTSSNFYFAAFALILSVYAFALILRIFPSDIPRVDATMLLHSMALLLVFLMLSFFFFLVHFLDLWRNNRIRALIAGILLLSILAIIVVFLQAIFVDVSADGKMFRLTFWAYLLLGGAVSYGAIALWLVLRTDNVDAHWLRLPTALIMGGYAVNIIAPDYPLDTVLFMLAAFWTAYAVIRQQVFTPMQRLNRELFEANSELQGTIAQLGREKERVEQLNTELLDSNRYRGEFLANMSHELRTPLNSIIGYSELLNSPIYGELNSQQRDRLERIYRNGQHLSTLIDSILDLSKIESDKFQLEAQVFPILPSIEAAVAKVKEQAEEKSLPISLEIPSNLPPLKGDAKRIEQVIYNLLDNAVKFTKEGHIELEVLSFNVKSGVADSFQLPVIGWLRDGAWMLIRVTDTGVGIAQEDLSRIFVNFAQLDGSRTREYGGIGLGLTIAKRLVELHFGIIWVQSKPNMGSSFYVALPIAATKA